MNQSLSAGFASDVELLAFVSSTPPFDQLSGALREALCERMTFVELAAGQVLYEKSAPGDAMYLVIEGRLQCDADSAAARATDIGPGEPVGEMQLLLGGERSASVRAVTGARLARLSRAAFEEMAEQSAALVVLLGELIRRRLREEQLARVLSEVFGELEHDALRRIENE